MIFNSALFKVSDNSNVLSVKCFNLDDNSNDLVGLLFCASVKQTKVKGKLNRGDLVKVVIIRSKKKIDRHVGNFLSFDCNEVVLLDQKMNLLGTRIFGLVSLELRKKKKYLKLLSLSSYFI